MSVELLSNGRRDGILDRLARRWGSVARVAWLYADRYGGDPESVRVHLGRIHRGQVRTVLPRTRDRLVGLLVELTRKALPPDPTSGELEAYDRRLDELRRDLERWSLAQALPD